MVSEKTDRVMTLNEVQAITQPASIADLQQLHLMLQSLANSLGPMLPMLVDLTDFLIHKKIIDKTEFEQFIEPRVASDKKNFEEYQKATLQQAAGKVSLA
jgi:hypothetical protein